MPSVLFDHRLRAIRRDRAVRQGLDTFLYDRAFDDCLERLSDVRKDFAAALLAGCPNAAWPERLGRLAPTLTVIEPGPLMAARAGAQEADLESLPFAAESFDLCVSVGLLDTANDLQLAAALVHRLLRRDGLFIGAVPGGESLPRLRRALMAADRGTGAIRPHVHPRIEAPALAQLLTAAGFAMPVVDIDRVQLRYRSLDGLVGDLRSMGATNIMCARSPRPLSRAALAIARTEFLDGRDEADEQVEILHFAAWKAP